MNFKLEKAIEILEQTPSTVKSLLGNLSEEWIYANAGENTWTPFDVVGHYIHTDETNWIPRAEIILEQGENITFGPFDRFAHFELFKGKNLVELLEAFAERRKQSLQTLKSWNLTEERLQLKGLHPEFGEVTLEQLLSTWVVHDLTHIRQITIVLAKQFSENVGPWKEYLSILK